MHNINVSEVYIPFGISIPWLREDIPDELRHLEIDGRKFDVQYEDEMYYHICLANPPPNTECIVNAQAGLLMILQTNGSGAMCVPLSLVIGIGTKGDVVLPTSRVI